MSALPLPLLVGLLLCLFSFSCPAGAPLVRPCPCLALPVSSSYSPSTVLLRRILQPVSVFASSADATAAFFPHTFPFPILLPRLPPVPSSTHLPCFQTPHKETPPSSRSRPLREEAPRPSSRRSPPQEEAPPSRRSPPFKKPTRPLLLLLGEGAAPHWTPLKKPPPSRRSPPSFKKPPLLLLLLGGACPALKTSLQRSFPLKKPPPLEEVGDPYPIGAVSIFADGM